MWGSLGTTVFGCGGGKGRCGGKCGEMWKSVGRGLERVDVGVFGSVG